MALRARSRLTLWAAAALPPLAWYGFQQGLALTMRGACEAAGVPLGPVWGVVSMLLCAGAGWFARPHRDQQLSDRFISSAAVLGAGLFAIAILFQSIATLIIPPCAR